MSAPLQPVGTRARSGRRSRFSIGSIRQRPWPSSWPPPLQGVTGSTVIIPALMVMALMMLVPVLWRTGPAGGQPPPGEGADPPGQDQTGPGGPSCLPAAWQVPVTAPVVDPFRPPSDPYGPGNRGIEYGTSDGDPFTVVADGHVGFVGSVGGVRYLVVHHDGDLRSTYGPLQTVLVGPGDDVSGGAEVGTASSGFHLTARLGDAYVDPNRYLARWCPTVKLVPVPPRASLRPVTDGPSSG